MTFQVVISGFTVYDLCQASKSLKQTGTNLKHFKIHAKTMGREGVEVKISTCPLCFTIQTIGAPDPQL